MMASRERDLATILAIGTANPPNCIYQANYPDFYFKITQCEHLTELKHKFKRICEKSAINKRYMHLTEDIITKNPNIAIYKAPSLSARQEILATEIPKLGKEAALNAIKEWGQPISKITHLIFCTTSGIKLPGPDADLTKLLGLQSSVKRFLLYQQGCFSGGTALRLAKDIAENNVNSRVLVVCSESTITCFQAPSDTRLDILVGSALFGDGAAAIIVGSNPDISLEHPLFQLLSATQTIIPDTENEIFGYVCEMGLNCHISKLVPNIIADNIEQCLHSNENFGVDTDWNSLFYVVHPGGRGILDGFDEKLGLTKDKLEATRYVLSEYGNMRSPSVLFVLDEMRKRSKEKGKTTTGDGLDLGLLLGFGPGLTVEVIALHSFPIQID